jgi:hypothetical protein
LEAQPAQETWAVSLIKAFFLRSIGSTCILARLYAGAAAGASYFHERRVKRNEGAGLSIILLLFAQNLSTLRSTGAGIALQYGIFLRITDFPPIDDGQNGNKYQG